MSEPITTIHKLETIPSVQLIILRGAEIVGTLAGNSKELAALLSRAANLEDYPVTLRQDSGPEFRFGIERTPWRATKMLEVCWHTVGHTKGPRV